MSRNIFRIFNPAGEKEDPVDRRRKQLRNAQRTYRDRRDRYTRSLEKELAQARASENKLGIRCDQLSATVETLTEWLAQCGVAIPPGIMENNAEDETIAKYRNAKDATVQDFTYLSPTTDTDMSSPGHARGKVIASPINGPSTVCSASSTPNITSVDKSTTPDPHSFTQKNHLPKRLGPDIDQGLIESNVFCKRMCDLDPIVVGMEFVLAIERPCLDHLHGDPNNPSEPTGHALTASAQLIFSCHYPQHSTLPVLPSFENAPSCLLQRLLELSTDLCSDGELTPTQAWNHIRNRPQFGAIEVQRLHKLAEKLRAAVKCHGFGAVIESRVFEQLVFQDLMFAQDF